MRLINLKNALQFPRLPVFTFLAAATFIVLSLHGCSQEVGNGQQSQEEGVTNQTNPVKDPTSREEVRDKNQQKEPIDKDIKIFLNEPSLAGVVEVVPDAIPIWRSYRNLSPTLILLSQNPFLYPIPAELSNEIDQLVLNGATGELIKAARISSARPILPLQQAVRACLKNQLFKKLVWVLPTRNPADDEIDFSAVKERLLTAGVLSAEEIETLKAGQGGLSGVIEQTPIIITTLNRLSGASETSIIHFDLSFFTSTYRNAVKTPIHGVVKSTLETLQAQNIPLYQTTISRTTGPNLVPLDFRFLGEDLATIINEPGMLDKELPGRWLNRQNILYLEYFFKPAETRKLVNELLEQTPEDPWVHYRDYKITAKEKDIEAALGKLDQAISLDSGYADEYLDIAERAKQQGLIKQAGLFLEKAQSTFPNNTLIAIQLAEVALAAGEHDKALSRIHHLQELDWSPLYHPMVPSYLDEMEARALNPPEVEKN